MVSLIKEICRIQFIFILANCLKAKAYITVKWLRMENNNRYIYILQQFGFAEFSVIQQMITLIFYSIILIFNELIFNKFE